MSKEQDDFLPSLDEIFSAPSLIKHLEIKQQDELDQEEKENVQNKMKMKKVKLDTAVVDLADEVDLSVNTAVFVTEKYDGGHVPAIIIGLPEGNEGLYTVKLYDGRIEKLGRRFIFCSDDKEFYSIKTIPLKKILNTENSLIRPFNKEAIVNIIKDHKDVLVKILTGDLESERDTSFRQGIQKRSSMNSGNALGPFTLAEYNFLLEYLPGEFMPSVVDELRDVLEERFEKTGKSLDHLLRQYAHLVLVPELTIRHILKMDDTVNTLEEANVKLMTDSKAYDTQTGNFINYLYSKQEMYQYARKERVKE